MSLPVSTNLDAMFNALVVALQTVPDPNAGGTFVFQNADNTWNIYDGRQTDTNTPAAMIVPADGVPSEFATSAENYRGYGFYIFVVMDTTTDTVVYTQTRKNMRLIVDSVLDAIDRSGMLSGTADMLQASSFRWLEENTANGLNIIAPLQISAQRTVEVRNVS
jgi:hypothetical protein